MVKNVKGGSGHKSQARKHTYESNSKKTRLSEDEMEVYACVTGILGGAMCSVICADGINRMCIIRGKFRGGRGKRGNMLSRGTWVLVGMREWSTEQSSEKEASKCDLLEVYNDGDKLELKKIKGVCWENLDINDGTSASSRETDMIEFSNTNHKNDYAELLQKSEGESIKLQMAPANDMPDFSEEDSSNDDEVDINDI